MGVPLWRPGRTNRDAVRQAHAWSQRQSRKELQRVMLVHFELRLHVLHWQHGTKVKPFQGGLPQLSSKSGNVPR